MEGTLRERDPKRAAQLLAAAAESGSPDAQYALAQLYARGDRRPARTIRSRCSGSPRRRAWGSSRRRSTTPSACSTATASPRTRRQRRPGSSARAEAGDPIAQNRLARILAIGAGATARPGGRRRKWHYLAQGAGKEDEWLDTFVSGLSEDAAPRGRRRRPTLADAAE